MITLHFLRYSEIASLSSEDKMQRILDLAKDNKIVLLEGRLTPEEETDLINRVMHSISPKFKGIEIASIEDGNDNPFSKLRKAIASVLLGNRMGLTIIGPATVVKEIKQDPSKIEVYMTGK